MQRTEDKCSLNKEQHMEALRRENKRYINDGVHSTPLKAYDHDKPGTQRVYYFFEKPSELLFSKLVQHVVFDNIENREPLLLNLAMTGILGFLALTNNQGRAFIATEIVLSAAQMLFLE
jgi:hypothetical protein